MYGDRREESSLVCELPDAARPGIIDEDLLER